MAMASLLVKSSQKSTKSKSGISTGKKTTQQDYLDLDVMQEDKRIKPREISKRIFANKSVNLETIKCYLFDMDYMLAEYKNPEYSELCFRNLLEQLVAFGYPSKLLKIKFDHSFSVRGLWSDNMYGNLLKVDSVGNILTCYHGFQELLATIIEDLYPNSFINLTLTDRVYFMNTLFNTPEIYALLSVVDCLEKEGNSEKKKCGIQRGSKFRSYKSIFLDVRSAMDFIHSRADSNCVLHFASEYSSTYDVMKFLMILISKNKDH